jgi:hypothetical protein
MIRQYDECIDPKWMPLARTSRCLALGRDLFGQKSASTIEEIRREEPASARHECATIIRHACTLTGCPPRGQTAQCASLIAPYGQIKTSARYKKGPTGQPVGPKFRPQDRHNSAFRHGQRSDRFNAAVGIAFPPNSAHAASLDNGKAMSPQPGEFKTHPMLPPAGFCRASP